jgi:nucleoside phosphorylase
MKVNVLEEILAKVRRLQSLMLAIATKKDDIENIKEIYSSLYKETISDIEFLSEEGIIVSNTNPFSSLWDWYKFYWNQNQWQFDARCNYIYNCYKPVIETLENEINSRRRSCSTGESDSFVNSDGLSHLINDIEKIQSIMKSASNKEFVISEADIYEELYWKTVQNIQRLQHIGLSIDNPNTFSSLWFWYGYSKLSLSSLSYSERQNYITELYISLTEPIKKALQKHQRLSTTTEELIQDTRSRFTSEFPISNQFSTSIPPGNQNENIVANQEISHEDVKVDFLIITAIEVERKEICKSLKISDRDFICKGSRVYWKKSLSLGNGEYYEVIIAQSPDMSNVDVSLTTSDAIYHWDPDAILLVGIAAAASEKQALGDLVIGTHTYYYARGKETPDGTLPEPIMYKADSTLFNRATQATNWTVSNELKRPDGTKTLPQIHQGVIASGESVIANAALRDKISKEHRKIVAIEMEGHGVSSAAWQQHRPVRCLVVKAICDMGDSSKNDDWHYYASAVATDFIKNFLLGKPLPSQKKQDESQSKTDISPNTDLQSSFRLNTPTTRDITKEFSPSDRKDLADLLQRSGQVARSSRKALCIRIDLDSGSLDFIDTSERDFAVELIHLLNRTGNYSALASLCNEVRQCVHGEYAQRATEIHSTLQLYLGG